MQTLAGDHALLRRLNRTAILRFVWESPGSSRSEVAQAVGITKSGVSLLVQELLEEGWLRVGASNAATNPGRPSIPLFINQDRFALIGLEIGVTSLNAVCVDPTGATLWANQHEGHSCNLRETLEQAALMIDGLGRKAARHGRKLIGVGIGVPGPVDVEHGLLLQAPNLGWENIALHRLFSEHLPEIPPERIHVDNDANLGVLGEYLFGQRRQSSDLLYIRASYGIGGGLLLNHQIYRGRHGFAGEVGHISLTPNGPRCSCGNRGCAETLCSVSGILRAAQKATGQELDWAAVLALYRAGEHRISKVMRHAATYLGVFVRNLVNTLDSETVLVGGAMAQLDETFFMQANRELQRQMFGSQHRKIKITPCSHGSNDCALGAAGYVWQKMLEPTSLTDPSSSVFEADARR